MNVQLSIDTSDLTAIIKKLSELGGPKMKGKIAKAINEGVGKAKPFAEGLISQTYNVPTPSLGVKKASAGDLQGALKASGGMKPVTEFSPSSTGARVGQVVSVSIIRGTRKPILPSSRGLGRGAFMIGDGRVMERRQDEKYPIFPVSTIGIPQMFGSRKVSEPAQEMLQGRVMEAVAKLWLASI